MSADGTQARRDVQAVRRRRDAAQRLPALDGLLGIRDPLDGPQARRLFIRVHSERKRAILTMNDPAVNRPAVATMLRRLDLPVWMHREHHGYVVALDEVPDVEALATFEGWLVRYTKPIPAAAR